MSEQKKGAYGVVVSFVTLDSHRSACNFVQVIMPHTKSLTTGIIFSGLRNRKSQNPHDGIWRRWRGGPRSELKERRSYMKTTSFDLLVSSIKAGTLFLLSIISLTQHLVCQCIGKSTKKKSSKAAPTEEEIAAEKSERLILESAIGKTQVVQGGPNGRAPGFYCKICDCVLKDSTSYLDHKNGKKRKRAP
jgi:hypothetical protein